MMHLRITLTLFVIGAQLAGCASTPEPVPITPKMLAEQEQMFSELYAGQPIKETMDLMAAYSANFFEVRDSGMLYQYVDAQYPGTDVLFGVYFEDRKLRALILEQDVTDFFSCRSYSRRGDEHWLSLGIRPYAEWIKARNRLASDFDRKAHHGETIVAGGVDLDYVSEAVAYTPIIVIALGIYGLDQIAGGYQQESRLKRERQYFLRTAPTIQIGYSEEQLIALMGSYDRRDDEVGSATVFTYYVPSYSYGLVNGQVVWKESVSMFQRRPPPRNSSTIPAAANCPA